MKTRHRLVGLSIMERVDDRADTIGTWQPARRGPGRHRHYYTGEWPLLVELATAGERSAA